MDKLVQRILGVSIFAITLWMGFWITSFWDECVYEWYKPPTVISLFLLGLTGIAMFIISVDEKKE